MNSVFWKSGHSCFCQKNGLWETSLKTVEVHAVNAVWFVLLVSAEVVPTGTRARQLQLFSTCCRLVGH